MNFQSFFQALAMAVAAFVLPFDVIGSREIDAYDRSYALFQAWSSGRPVEEIDFFEIGMWRDIDPQPLPEIPDLDDEIALLLERLNPLAQSNDYNGWEHELATWESR